MTTSEESGSVGRPDEDTASMSFVGHESFPLRYGWLKKCADAVATDPEFFANDRADVTLGVGKNMVRAVRHWGLVSRVIEEIPGARGRALRVAPVGTMLFGAHGADPYLEDPRTLWIIHWLLCTHPEKATTWRWAFGVWGRDTFTREELRAALRALCPQSRASESTLTRDAEVFLRTYLPARASRAVPLEDTLDSPLTELNVVREDPVEGRCELVRGPKNSLDASVFGYSVLDFWRRTAPLRESLHVDAIAHGRSSPGRIFCLDERSLHERLSQAEAWSRGTLLYDQTAGVRQLMRRRAVEPLTWLADALSTGRARAA